MICKKCARLEFVKNGKDRFRCKNCGAECWIEKPKVLAFADDHAPFTVKGRLEFLKRVKEQVKPDMVVICGDEIDHHVMSRHLTEPDAYGAQAEFEKASEYLELLARLFPVAILIVGNHCQIPKKQANALGILDRFIKPLEDVYPIPDTWNVLHEVVLDDVLYFHGDRKGASGHTPALTAAKNVGMSCVCGHWHTKAGTHYSKSPSGKTVFGLDLGCGFDKKSYAARYGHKGTLSPVLGCGVVQSPTEGYFVPMRES